MERRNRLSSVSAPVRRLNPREPAAQGYLLRLWRPPLQAGEWRTLGLFAAADGDRLKEVLASMPLRVWCNDDVALFSPHPNGPGTYAPGSREGHGVPGDLHSGRPAGPAGAAASALHDRNHHLAVAASGSAAISPVTN